MVLPAGRAANRPIKITFSYDANQRMHCTFHDVESGQREEKTFDLQSGDKSGGGSQDLDDLTADLSDLVIE